MNYLTIKTSGVRGYRLHVTKLYLYFKFILYHIMNQYHMVLFVLWLYHRIYCVMCYKSYVALIQYYRNSRNSNIWKYLYQSNGIHRVKCELIKTMSGNIIGKIKIMNCIQNEIHQPYKWYILIYQNLFWWFGLVTAKCFESVFVCAAFLKSTFVINFDFIFTTISNSSC